MANKQRVYAEEVIDEIIYRYIVENDITGDIEYSSVRDFALELRKNNDSIFTEKLYYRLLDKTTGKVSEKIIKNIELKDDFWRKPQYQGRQKIDAANELLSKTVAKTKKRQVYIPNVDFILETHKNNINQLRIHLKPLEEQLKISIKNEETLEDKIDKLEDQINELKSEKIALRSQNDKYQTALYKMFEYSVSREVPLENQLNTGKGKTPRVEQALREAFSGDLTAFYLKFKTALDTKGNQNKVSDIDMFRNKKETEAAVLSYEEEYDFE